jgi:hypothetical protein
VCNSSNINGFARWGCECRCILFHGIVSLWSATIASMRSVVHGCRESHHLHRTLTVVNRTGSSLFFFESERHRIDSGCFKLFPDVEASCSVPFYVADAAGSSFSPPILLSQTARYHCKIQSRSGFTYAAIADVVIGAAEAQVTCTTSSCISVTNPLAHSLCALSLSDDNSAARFICEIPPSASAQENHTFYLPA